MSNAILYAINFPNGKVYIGMTVKSLRERMRAHYAQARFKPIYPVNRALNKYGTEATFTTLVVGNRNYILDLEKAAIASFRTRDADYGYNVALGGDGAIWTPEMKAKVSAAHKGRPKSAEHREKLKRRLFSEEARSNMSLAAKGRVASTETKAKMSAARKGRVKSIEHQARITAALKGRIHSPETRMKMSAKAKVRSAPTPETRAKITAAGFLRIDSAETKAKKSAAAKLREENRRLARVAI